MLSASYALSQFEIPYDDVEFTPNGVEQRWADVQTIFAAVKSGTYRTPGFAPATMDPAAIQPGDLISLQAAQMSYTAAVNSGNISLAHKDTDIVNRFRVLTDGQEFVGQPDLDILGHSPTSVGTLVRLLNNQSVSGQPPIIFNVTEAQAIMDSLNAAAVIPPPPSPPNTPVTMPVPPGVTMPPNVPFTNPADGSNWIIYTSPFGSVAVRIG